VREFHHIVDIDVLLPEEAARMRLAHNLLFEPGPPADPGIGTLTEVLVSRPTQRRPRQLYRATGHGNRRIRLDQKPRHARPRRRP
jgi:hypothetical protein